MANKKTLLIGAAIMCLTIGCFGVVFSNNGFSKLVRNFADSEVGKVTFQNNGSNVEESFLIEEDSVNYYTELIGGRLYGGTPLYAKASHCTTLGESDEYIAKMFNGTVSFCDELGAEYKFQNLSTIEIYSACAVDITLYTSIDGENFTESYVCTEDSGFGSFSIANQRYVRFSTGGDIEFYISKVVLNYSCSYDYVEPEIKTLTVYSSNDFHGKIQENGDEVGLAKYATFFKNKSAQENTLLIDSGDSWQGSAYSNLNYGNLVNDVMIEAGWDVRTVGNHDFDWGVDALKANTARQYKGKTLTTLAANIYDYNFDTKQFGDTQQSEIGDKTATFILENGLKVGVVGVIGYSQITSINSLYTHDIGFKNHINTIKEEATNLRNTGCNIVIASCHTGEEEIKGYGLEDYVDLVLCAHTHRYEVSTENGLTFAQFSSNGRMAGEITLSFDTGLNSVVHTNVNSYYSSDIKDAVTSIDSTINSLINASITTSDAIASEVVANNVTGDFTRGYTLEPLMTQAVYDTAIAEGYTDIICSYVNDARCNYVTPTDGKLTYADIYEAFPFDNTVYIIEITGREVMNELNKYNYACFSQDFLDGGKLIETGKKYKIACLDYLAFHTDDSRYYNYFDDNNGNYLGTLTDNYRIILKNWLADKGYNSGTELNPYNFNRNYYKYSNIGQISWLSYFDLTFMMNDGTDTVYDTVEDVKINDLIMNHLPNVNPTRENYTFDGWYLDIGCNNPIGYTAVTSNLTIYAKWVSASTYSTGDITYNDFVEDSTATNVKASNIASAEKTISLTHSAMVIGIDRADSPYNNTCFKIAANGFLCATAPTGYIITSFSIRICYSYDNFNFYAGTEADVGNELSENIVKSESSPWWTQYSITPNSQSVYMQNTYNGVVNCYEINITINPVA